MNNLSRTVLKYGHSRITLLSLTLFFLLTFTTTSQLLVNQSSENLFSTKSKENGKKGQVLQAVTGCDHTIPLDVTTADGNDNYSGVQAGETVCVEAGERDPLRLRNFHGSISQPITFINDGGQVIFLENHELQPKSLFVVDSSFLRLTGTGSIDTYGFKAMRGVRISDITTDIEIDHFEITGSSLKFAGGAGYDYPGYDYFHENAYIHHNYAHDIRGCPGEGFYIGSNHTPGDTGMVMKDLTMSYNITETTGTEGINVKVAIGTINIHHNTVNDAAFDADDARIGQQSCVTFHSYLWDQLSEYANATSYHVYNNKVSNCKRFGINHYAYGSLEIYNNLIVDADNYAGIAISPYSGTTSVYNNTLIQNNPSDFGVRISSSFIASGLIYDNIFAGSFGTYIRDLNSLFTISNNITESSISTLQFVNAGNNDYHLSVNSLAVDFGSTSGYPLFDLDDASRPYDGDGDGVSISDIGAYEYGGTVPTSTPTPTLTPTPTPPPPIPGDLDGDDDVDIFDLILVGSHFGENVGVPCTLDPCPDTDGDGDVDIFDLITVGSHFGETG
jgi:hypothetical protein